MAKSNSELLDRPITELGLGREFEAVTEMLGFFTLADLARHKTSHLLELPGFSLGLLYTYVSFMEANRMGNLIDP